MMEMHLLPPLYMLAAAGFILAIKWMNSPATARRGVIVGEIGMLLAVVGTLLRLEVVNYEWILIAFFVGIGDRRAHRLLHADDRGAAADRALARLRRAGLGADRHGRILPHELPLTALSMGALVLETLLGFLTFTASIMAFGKLQEILPTRPLTYKGQNFVNLRRFRGWQSWPGLH